MSHELEYIVDKAVMLCDSGVKPSLFRGTNNTTVKINGCQVCNTSDKIPVINIPEFGVCGKTSNPCVPLPIAWTDTYKVKVKGKETLLFKSKLPCSLGGKIEFVTSGQVPISQEELDEINEENAEEAPEEEEGLSWWDAAEMIPFAGGVIGVVRSGSKGDWLGLGLSVASIGLDVAGLFSFGGGNVASAAVKGGKLAKAGAKVAKATSKVGKVGKAALTAGGKVLTKTGAKTAAKALASKVDDIAIKYGKICVFACFPEGTLVHTNQGSKKIEEIQQGDLVWAQNEETGEIALQRVTTTFQREVDATVQIELEGETVETTAEHPFYTQNGWKDAADLTEEDQVQTKDQKWYKVKGQNFLYEKKKVYNFEVENWHTYFVGVLAWLVHNAKKAGACISTTVKKVSNRLKYLGRTPGKNSKTGKEVFERMSKEVPPTARIRRGKKEFWDPTSKKWRDIKEADMGHHPVDAVDYWNRTGRLHGSKSKEVRKWMLDSKNYRLQYNSANRSAGGSTRSRYRPPQIKKPKR